MDGEPGPADCLGRLMLAEIREQPDALRRLLDQSERLDPDAPGHLRKVTEAL